MGYQKIVPTYLLLLIGAIIAVLTTGCPLQPMVKPAPNRVIVSQLG